MCNTSIQGNFWPDIRSQLDSPADWDRIDLDCFICNQQLVLDGLAPSDVPENREAETAMVMACGHIIGHRCFRRLFPTIDAHTWEKLLDGHIGAPYDERYDYAVLPVCPICDRGLVYIECQGLIEPLPLPSSFAEVRKFPRMAIGFDADKDLPPTCYHCGERELLRVLSLEANKAVKAAEGGSGSGSGSGSDSDSDLPSDGSTDGSTDWIAVNPRTRTVVPCGNNSLGVQPTDPMRIRYLKDMYTDFLQSGTYLDFLFLYAPSEWSGLYLLTRMLPDGHRRSVREAWLRQAMLRPAFVQRRDLSTTNARLHVLLKLFEQEPMNKGDKYVMDNFKPKTMDLDDIPIDRNGLRPQWALNP